MAILKGFPPTNWYDMGTFTNSMNSRHWVQARAEYPEEWARSSSSALIDLLKW